MKIKEVEKEIGVNARTIRFYEEMGLIHVNRDPENKYRDFDEGSVKRLKEIKLFRGLGITMEEIRRYYQKEITMEEMMDHQLNEIRMKNDDMKLKEKLCQDIKDNRIPLVNYTLDQYDEVIKSAQHKPNKKDAGNLVSQWNLTDYSLNRIRLMECFLFPVMWLMIGLFVALVLSLINLNLVEENTWVFVLITTIVTSFICYFDYIAKAFPKELYEFRERGVYYIKKESKKHYQKVKRSLKKGDVQTCMDFVPYDEIEVLKIWFHRVAKAPITGSSVYQIDIYLHTVYDEVIQIDTGLFGVSDEQIKVTLEILKEHAHKVVDPFRILQHYDLERHAFYKYLDEVYSRREHLRVFRNLDHKKTTYKKENLDKNDSHESK